MRKFFAISGLAIFLFCSIWIPAYADSGTYVSLSYLNYTIPGSVNGSKNGYYYHLTKGGVSLQVTETNSNNGQMYVDLRRYKSWGVDPSYGECRIYGTGWYNYKVDTDSDKYYIFASGGASGTVSKLKGYMHNHHH